MYQIAYLNRRFLGLIMIVFVGCKQPAIETLPYYNGPDFTPKFFASPKVAKQVITHTIGNFDGTNQYGQPFSTQDLKGKIQVANFVFTRCVSICPTLTKHMKWVEKAYLNDKDVELLSYSVTPWMDSVSVLRAFSAKHKVNANNWQFITGNTSAIYQLARQSYFAEEDIGFSKDSSNFLHTEHVLLVDKTGRIRGIYNGTLPLDIEQLIKDITILKEE
jgi:protein SCO1/2